MLSSKSFQFFWHTLLFFLVLLKRVSCLRYKPIGFSIFTLSEYAVRKLKELITEELTKVPK